MSRDCVHNINILCETLAFDELGWSVHSTHTMSTYGVTVENMCILHEQYVENMYTMSRHWKNKIKQLNLMPE